MYTIPLCNICEQKSDDRVSSVEVLNSLFPFLSLSLSLSLSRKIHRCGDASWACGRFRLWIYVVLYTSCLNLMAWSYVYLYILACDSRLFFTAFKVDLVWCLEFIWEFWHVKVIYMLQSFSWFKKSQGSKLNYSTLLIGWQKIVSWMCTYM